MTHYSTNGQAEAKPLVSMDPCPINSAHWPKSNAIYGHEKGSPG